MDSNLDTHAPSLGIVNVLFFVDAPSVSAKLFSRRDDHVPHQLPLLHQGGAHGFGTGPRLRTTAVQVDAAAKRSHKGRGSCEFLWHIGSKLDYCWRLGPVGGYCEVWRGKSGVVRPGMGGMAMPTAVSCKMVSVELLGQDHGCPTQIRAILVDGLAKG